MASKHGHPQCVSKLLQVRGQGGGTEGGRCWASSVSSPPLNPLPSPWHGAPQLCVLLPGTREPQGVCPFVLHHGVFQRGFVCLSVPLSSPRCGARGGLSVCPLVLHHGVEPEGVCLSVCPSPSPHPGVCQSFTVPLELSVPLSRRDPGSLPRPPAPWTWPMAAAGRRCTWRVSGDSAGPARVPEGRRSASVLARSCQRLHRLLRDPL